MDLGVSGLASGFDWRSLVDQISDVERSPQRRLLGEQNQLQQRNNAYGSIKTQLLVLQSRVNKLKEPSLFEARRADSTDATAAFASAAPGAAQGNYAFSFQQLATAASRQGAANAGAALSASDDVSTLTLANSGFSSAFSAGSFTVNGHQIQAAGSDTLQAVFDRIQAATGGDVTATYSSASDTISLSSAANTEIILGSATDTSNFLNLTKLKNNGSGTVVSSGSLGAIRSSAILSAANFAVPVSDGGAGAGEFKINGVSIAFDVSADSVQNILDRINSSAAGVTASYDSVGDRFNLTNKSTGDIGVALEDVTGNFIAASGLGSGALKRGKDLLYTLNGGGQLTSRSNTVGPESHGVTGLTVTALKGSEVSTATWGGTELGNPNYVGSIGGAGADSTRLRTSGPHLLESGHGVKFESTGSLPFPLEADTLYHVRQISSTELKIYATAADADADNNAIDFGASPSFTGDLYITRVDPLDPPSSTSTSGPPATVSITVSSDQDKVKTAITDFLAEYNKVQSLIDTQTASSTDSKGKVTAGLLSNESDVSELSSRLRSTAYGQLAGLPGALKSLADIGIASNGNDNSLKIEDDEVLAAALASNLTGVMALFSDGANGLATQLSAYLEKTVGDDGTLLARQGYLAKQASGIDIQVSDLERIVQANRQRLLDSFAAMEAAQANINQQLRYLQQSFK